MKNITVVGLGPGPLGQLTREAKNELLAGDKVFFRTAGHPAYQWLEQQDRHVVCFDRLYTLTWKEGGERIRERQILFKFVCPAARYPKAKSVKAFLAFSLH
jgi:uncharacterized protein YabN with tetrapyrrole methylase and pyrophosphatase domain